MNPIRRACFLLPLTMAMPFPADAGHYDGPVDAGTLTAAYEGWRKLHQEIHLIDPIYGVVLQPSVPNFGPGYGVVVQWPDFGGVVIGVPATPWTVSVDADFGEAGAVIYLGSEMLRIGASFDTFRDVVVGYTTRSESWGWTVVDIVFVPESGAEALPVTPPITPPPPQPRPAGPAWIDTQGHDFGIHGRVTAYQTLYKQGEGTLRLTTL